MSKKLNPIIPKPAFSKSPLARSPISPEHDYGVHNKDASLKSIAANLKLFEQRIIKCQKQYKLQDMQEMLTMLLEMPYFSRQRTPMCSLGYLHKIVETELSLPPGARHGHETHTRTLINLLDLVTYLRALKDVYNTRLLLPVEILTVTSLLKVRMRGITSSSLPTSVSRKPFCDSDGMSREISEASPCGVFSMDFEMKAHEDRDRKVACNEMYRVVEEWMALLSADRVWFLDKGNDDAKPTSYLQQRQWSEKIRHNSLITMIPQILEKCHILLMLTRRWLGEHIDTSSPQLHRRVQNLQVAHKDLSHRSRSLTRELDSQQSELRTNKKLLHRLDYKSSTISNLSRKHHQTQSTIDSLRGAIREAECNHDSLLKELAKADSRGEVKNQQVVKLRYELNELHRHVLTSKLRAANYNMALAQEDMKIHSDLQPIFRDYKSEVSESCHQLQQAIESKTFKLNSLENTMQPLREEKWKLQEELLRRSMNGNNT